MEIGLVLEMATSDGPDRPAVVDGDGRTLTRGELLRASAAVAARLAGRGTAALGYLTTNHVAFPTALFGAAAAGVPFVPLNYRLADEQLAGMLARHPGIAVVVGPDEAERAAALGVEAIDRDALVVEALAGGEVDPPPPPDDEGTAVLLYTSGTTSEPKAAVLRHRHLTSYVIGTVEFAGCEADEAVLVSVPPYHIAGVSNLLTNVYCGRRIVYLDPFDAERWLAVVEAERVTHAMVVPTMLARIVEALGDRPGPRLPSLAYGGARMPAPVLERALALFPDTAFTNAYGLTETSSTITLLGPDDHRAAGTRLGSVGRAVPGIEVEVRGPDGAPLPLGEVGDVHVRGEQVSGEYVGVGSGVDADGWFATRDRGHLDADGYLFIDGRSDDTIIRGGENVAPAEVEDVLLRHPDVTECAVVGVPDDEWGQRIAAAVVLRAGATADEDELRAWARRHLRGSRTPDSVAVRSELPYTATGKLLRREVRASFEQSGVGG